MDKIATIKFKGRLTLDLFRGHDEDDYEPTDFFAGEIHEVLITEGDALKVADLHFNDGALAMNVPVKLFDILPEEPK